MGVVFATPQPLHLTRTHQRSLNRISELLDGFEVDFEEHLREEEVVVSWWAGLPSPPGP